MAGESLVGPLPSVWDYTTLGEVCNRGGGSIQTGPFGSQLHASDYVSHGIPSIMPQNIGDNRVIEDGIARITTHDAERLNRYLVRTGDIVYSRRGDVEKRALIREKEDRWLCGTGCLRVRFGEHVVDPSYASYYLGHPEVRAWIVRHAQGATMPNLNTSILSSLPFIAPPIEEQRAIAHILGTLDDKIELNRRMNETLEAMAQAIFRSWFVDFALVRAKAEGRDPGLPKHIADLFPDRFERSESGEIPAGWTAGTVSEDFDVTMGQSPPGNTYNEVGNGLPFYQGRRDFGFRYPALRVYCSAPKRFAQAGDTLVSVRAPVGDVNMVDEPCCIGRGVAAVQHKTASRSYTYYAMQSLKAYFDYFESDGTVFGSVSKSGFATIPFLIPPPKLVEYFESTAFSIDQRIEVNEKQSQALASIRDALLPKLISGELRVPDAGRMVEEALRDPAAR